jgi:hypothetical protein
MNKSVLRIVVALLVAGFAAKGNGGGFTQAEQDLINRNLTMEVYRPNSEVSHNIETVHGAKGSGPILVFIFDRAEVESARNEGHKLAATGYTAKDAERVLLQEANAKYPRSPFFVKCFMHEAADAFNAGK